MVNKKMFLKGFLTLALIAGTSFAADPHGGHSQKGHGNDPVLPSGNYFAKVAAMVCDGCPSLIQKTMLGVKGIGSATVDQKTQEVRFNVKENASVKWSDLQKALKASADKMGMGADFKLSEFKIDDQQANAAVTEDRTLASGYYTAKVAAIVCGGCPPLIEKTMREVPGIGAAQVDSKASAVRFTVLAGKKVKVADLQNALKSSANQMGMGADYTLSDLKTVKK